MHTLMPVQTHLNQFFIRLFENFKGLLFQAGLWSVLLVLVTGSRLGAQTATITLPQAMACPGQAVVVPVAITNFSNIGAITLYIGYDTTVLEYTGFGNAHTAFPGLMVNPVVLPSTQVNIVWSSTTAGNVANGVLVDLFFTYRTDSCELKLQPGCEIANPNLVPIPFIGTNGFAMAYPPYILAQPHNTIVTEGEPAYFTCAADGADTYQWQERGGAGWQNLQNSALYQNVNGSQMTITSTTLAMSGNWYRCFLTANGGCQVYSDSARLTVLPYLTALLELPDTIACPGTSIGIPLSGYGLDSIAAFDIRVAYNPLVAVYTGLGYVHPLLANLSATVLTNPVPHIKFAWAGTSPYGVNLPDGRLFEMLFDFSVGQTPLAVLSTTTVTRFDLINYNIQSQNGALTEYPFPQITQHPSDTTVINGLPARFRVTASGGIAYQWYESRDDGSTWNPLSNAYPYMGTKTPNLWISKVNPQMDFYRYRCSVMSNLCEKFSGQATLRVDTLTGLSAERESKGGKFPEILQKYFSRDEMRLEINAIVPGMLRVRLYDVYGRMHYSADYNLAATGMHTLNGRYRLSGPGVYLAEFVFVSAPEQVRRIESVFIR